MKKVNKRKGLIRSIKRLCCLLVSTSMLLNEGNLLVVKQIYGGVWKNLVSHAEELPSIDTVLSKDDRGRYQVLKYEDLIELSKCDPLSYQDARIIVSGDYSNLYVEDFVGFNGIGTYSVPFKGEFEVTMGTTLYVNSDKPFFNAIYNNATVSGTVSMRRPKDSESALLAETVRHYDGSDELFENLNIFLAASTDNEYFKFGGIIGTVEEECNVKLNVENHSWYSDPTDPSRNTSSNVQKTDTVGFAACVLENNSVLTFNYSDSSGSFNGYTVTSTEGNAGGLVGEMHNKSELNVLNNFAYTGTVTAALNAGGLVGYGEDEIIQASCNILAVINGGVTSGGMVGNQTYTDEYVLPQDETAIVFDNKRAMINAVLSGNTAGGLFGILNNSSSTGQEIIVTSTVARFDVSSSYDPALAAGQKYGGIIGQYTAANLASSLKVTGSSNNMFSITSSGAADIYGGVVGCVSGSAAYIKAEYVQVDVTDIEGGSNFGGVIGYADESGHFIDIKDITLNSSEDVNSIVSGGIVGSFLSGVLRLSGHTDLGGMGISSAEKHGQIVGERSRTLIYALGDGNNTSTWKLTRPAGATDAVGNWGEVIRLVDSKNLESVGIVTINGHEVTVTGGTASIGNITDFVKTALNMQLENHSGNVGALVFSNGTNWLESNLTLSADLSLSGTGITGFSRDNDSQEFSGSLDGGSHKITLAIGEPYPSGTDPTNGKGKVYRHNRVGLFGCIKANDKNIKNLTIDGSVNASSIGYTGGLCGAISADEKKNLTVENVVFNAALNVDNGNTGGISGYSAGGVTFNDVTLSGSITSSANNIAGLVAVTKNASLILNGVTADGIIINGTKDDGLRLNGNGNGNCGGVLGYKWETTSADLISVMVSDAVITSARAANSAGLVYEASGHWGVQGVAFDGFSLNTATSKSVGMMVNDGKALFLEQTVPDCYSILPDAIVNVRSGVTVNVADNAVKDEYVAYSINNINKNGESGQGIISIPAVYTNERKVIMDGINCNTYQNQLFNVNNKYSRYYYNLDVIRVSHDTNEKKLLLWSVWQYSADSLKDYFKTHGLPADGNNKTLTLTGSFNMEYLSYYPVDVPVGWEIVLDNAQFHFYNAEINQSEDTRNSSSRRTDEFTQHFLMHHGLFRSQNNNVDDSATLISSITLNNSITFSGTTGHINISNGISKGSGALICGTISGVNYASNPYDVKITSNDSTDIIFDDFKINASITDDTYAPLFINKIGGYSNVLISGVETTNYVLANGVYAASSLIGDAGSNTAGSVKVNFSRIKLDGSKSANKLGEEFDNKYGSNRTIFKRATLLNSLAYTDNSGSGGSYNFTYDQDWGTGNPHYVTYGKELTDTLEFKDSHGKSKEKKYLRSGKYVAYSLADTLIDSDDRFNAGFLPYVYTPYNTASDERTHELQVNLESADFLKGCGTYEDPYLIENASQLMALNEIVETPKTAFKFNYPISEFCDKTSGHVEYNFDASSATAADQTDLMAGDIQAYFRDAYFMITNDITVEESINIGESTAVKNTFRGVIVGQELTNEDGTKRYPTITLKQPNSFIEIANGVVIKNLNFVFDFNGKSIDQSNSLMFAPGSNNINSGTSAFGPNDASCAYYGGLIGQVMGGDNIIDNVTVKYEDNSVITLSGDYAHLVPIGNYVGIVRGGILMFRNMSSTTSDNIKSAIKVNTASGSEFGNTLITNKLNDLAALYVNPYIGRVMDGCAVYLKRYAPTGTPTLDNGTKNYVINDIDDPFAEGVTITNKLSMKSPSDQSYQFDSTDIQDGGSRAWSAVQVPDGQTLFVMALITQSSAASFQSAKNNAGDTDPSGYSSEATLGSFAWAKMAYYKDTPYNTGYTRLATYSNVGNANNTDADYLRSKNDRGTANNDTYPFLIYYFTDDGTSDTHINGSSTFFALSGRKLSLYYPVRLICGSSTRITVELSADSGSTYTLPSGFRGINAMFDSCYMNNSDRMVICMMGFKGNGNTIDMKGISVSEYDNDNYHSEGVGLFSRYQLCRDTSVPSKTYSAAKVDIKGKSSSVTGYFATLEDGDRKYLSANNFTLTGNVTYNCIKKNGDSADKEMTYVGGFGGQSYCRGKFGRSSSGDLHVYFNDITLRNLTVTGNGVSTAGGVTGRTERVTLNTSFRRITAKNVNVSAEKCAGVLSGSVDDKTFKTGNSITNKRILVEHCTVDGVSTVESKKFVSNSDISDSAEDNRKLAGGSGSFIGYCKNLANNNTVLDFWNCYTSATINGSVSGGIIGQNYNGQLNFAYCDVKGVNISNDKNSDAASPPSTALGGLLGTSESTADINISHCSVSESNFYEASTFANTNGSKRRVAGFIGRIKGAVNGFDLYCDRNTIETVSQSEVASWIAQNTSSASAVKLLAVSKNITTGNLDKIPDFGNESFTSPENYIVYSGYNNEAQKTEGTSTVDYKPNIDKYPISGVFGDLPVWGKPTGDGIVLGRFETIRDNAIAFKNADDSSKNYKYYSKATDEAELFAEGGQYFDSLTNYNAQATIDGSPTISNNFPVLLIQSNDSSVINQIVHRYATVLTNDKVSPIDRIDVQTYLLTGDEWIVADDNSLRINSTGQELYANPGKYDNSRNQFTMLRLSYASPVAGSNEKFYLYIPAIVKKVLQFTVDVKLMTGTNHYSEDYAGAAGITIENHGVPVTSLITYTYKRKYQEWIDSLNSGESYNWYFNKSIMIKPAVGQRTTLPIGTKVTLIDRNKGDETWYSITSENNFNSGYSGYDNDGKLDFMKFVSINVPMKNLNSSSDTFTPLTMAELMCTQIRLKANTNGSAFVVCNKDEGATVQAYINAQEKVWLRPVNTDDHPEDEEAAKYDLGLPDNIIDLNVEMNIEESYFLTICTDENNTGLLNSSILYKPLTLDGGDVATYNLYRGQNVESGSALVMGNFFKMENFVNQSVDENELINSTSDDIHMQMSVDLKFQSTEMKNAFDDYATSVGLYQGFVMSYVTYQNGSTTAKYKPIFSATTIKSGYTITYVDKNNEYKTNYYPSKVDGNGSNILDYNTVTIGDSCSEHLIRIQNSNDANLVPLIRDISDAENPLHIVADIYISFDGGNFSEDKLCDQFPSREDSSRENRAGLEVRGRSTISYFNNPSQLLKSVVSTGSPEMDTNNNRYYVTKSTKANLKYDAVSIDRGESLGDVSQLGINAARSVKEVKGDIVPIHAIAVYDASMLIDEEKAESIVLDFKLQNRAQYHEDNSTTSVLPIGSYLYDGINITLNNSTVSPTLVNDHYIIKLDNWKELSEGTGSLSFDTDFRVKTGDLLKAIENGYYSNYRLTLSIQLLDNNGVLVGGSDCKPDHITYTNCKIYTDIIE